MLSETMDFPNKSEALAFRRATGCGGFIFEDDDTGEVMLIPPRSSRGEVMTPHMLRYQPVIRGRRGKLH